MDQMLVSVNYQDPAWIAIAFVLGLLCKQIKLPPLVGFLIAGFLLHALGAKADTFLLTVADLGVTLLLFTIGLKLHLSSLLRTEIWGTTFIHMGASITVTGLLLLGLGSMGFLVFSGIDFATALIIAFALSFSSTVFVVKTLEERGAMASRYGQIAIGILIMQDIAAVGFLAVSSGKVPSIWALGLLLLIPGRHLLGKVLEMCGHNELLTVFGFVLALGGAAVFEAVGMKGDLGALILGVLLASHKKGSELAHTLMSFKDVFLVCFFLSIGLTGLPSWETVVAAFILLMLIPFKSALFFWLFSKFKLRARGSTLGALALGNYSEFGLIVGAIAISAGWLGEEWLTVIALALSASFILASPFNVYADKIFSRYRMFLSRFQSTKRLPGDENIVLSGYTVLVFGMGRVGRAVYTEIHKQLGPHILGIDLDEKEVQKLSDEGHHVVRGDATSPEFWSRFHNNISDIQMILLAMPIHYANLAAARQLRERGFEGTIIATAKFKDEEAPLLECGVNKVFNIYTEAGIGAVNSIQDLVSKIPHPKNMPIET